MMVYLFLRSRMCDIFRLSLWYCCLFLEVEYFVLTNCTMLVCEGCTLCLLMLLRTTMPKNHFLRYEFYTWFLWLFASDSFWKFDVLIIYICSLSLSLGSVRFEVFLVEWTILIIRKIKSSRKKWGLRH